MVTILLSEQISYQAAVSYLRNPLIPTFRGFQQFKPGVFTLKNGLQHLTPIVLEPISLILFICNNGMDM